MTEQKNSHESELRESLEKLARNINSLSHAGQNEDIKNLRTATQELKKVIENWIGFRKKLNTFLNAYNELEINELFKSSPSVQPHREEVEEFRNCLRQIVENLTSCDILSYNLAWPRRYLYERACNGKLAEMKGGFIYKALQKYNKVNQSDEDSLDIQWERIQQAFKAFYEIAPASSCLEIAEDGKRIEDKNLNKRAFDIGRLLLRIFFFEGLAVNLLKCWERYENLIYFAEKRYRDHYLHLFYDFLLGCVILEGMIPKIEHFWKNYINAKIDPDMIYVRIMRRWLIASLFHDIGYTAQSLKNVSRKIQDEFFTKVPGFEISELKFENKPLKEEIDEFYESLSFILSEDEFSFKIVPNLRYAKTHFLTRIIVQIAETVFMKISRKKESKYYRTLK